LRIIARKAGVHSPSKHKKADLINSVLEIQSNPSKAVYSNLGRRVKNTVVQTILENNEDLLSPALADIVYTDLKAKLENLKKQIEQILSML
jgi:hypothetical protein